MKMISPNTQIIWVASDGTFVPSVPTAAALNADLTSGKAKNISAAIATGYTLNPTASDTDDSKTIVDEANSASRGAGNYEAELSSYLEADPVTNTTSEYLVFQGLFEIAGASGTLLRRVGRKSTVAPAATHLYDIFTVESDEPTYEEPDSGGPIKMTVTFNPLGFMNVNEPLG